MPDKQNHPDPTERKPLPSEVDAEVMERLLSAEREALTRDAVSGILMSYYHSICGQAEAGRFEQSILPKMEQVLGGNPHSFLRYGRNHIDTLGDAKPRELVVRMDELSQELSNLAGTPVLSTAEVCRLIARGLRGAAADQANSTRRINVAAVILFGSYARGQQHAASDLDLTVIFEDDSSDFGCELIERSIRREYAIAGYSPPTMPLLDLLEGASLATGLATLAVRLDNESLLQSGYLVIPRDKAIHERPLRSGIDARRVFDPH